MNKSIVLEKFLTYRRKVYLFLEVSNVGNMSDIYVQCCRNSSHISRSGICCKIQASRATGSSLEIGRGRRDKGSKVNQRAS